MIGNFFFLAMHRECCRLHSFNCNSKSFSVPSRSHQTLLDASTCRCCKPSKIDPQIFPRSRRWFCHYRKSRKHNEVTALVFTPFALQIRSISLHLKRLMIPLGFYLSMPFVAALQGQPQANWCHPIVKALYQQPSYSATVCFPRRRRISCQHSHMTSWVRSSLLGFEVLWMHEEPVCVRGWKWSCDREWKNQQSLCTQ